MNALINAAFSRTRTVALCFAMILLMGASAYQSIPKESYPDIAIPTIYVSVTYEGIAPEDAERLLARPLEKELQSIEGLKEMRSIGAEGRASVTLEFDAGFDADQALQDVREKVDIARPELPPGSDEPRVTEINVALFPVLTVVLSGPLPERSLITIARELKDRIEALSGVLEVDIGGDREEMLEVTVSPAVMQAYNLSFTDVFNFVQQNNQLVAAGALDTGAGRMVFKVPGVIESLEDIIDMPVKVTGNRVVTFQDVAQIRRTYKDPEGFARVGGEPALALEISKRSGANIIETIEAVREVIEQARAEMPPDLAVGYLQDQSEEIKTMLGDLQNNVITAIILVMIVVVAALGVRPAILVGLAIPGAFLAGILVINSMGLTLNIVVLFSLILVVGMLVDGAIVTTELADRKVAEGIERKVAYAEAAKRMAWPVTASTATTLVVFVPLVAWPGIVGEFMKYLPITVLITLIASLAMALVFIPVLGGVFGSRRPEDPDAIAAVRIAESGDLAQIGGLTGYYLRGLRRLLHHPFKVLGAAFLCLIAGYGSYLLFGRGVEFFPSQEPDLLQVQVQARGDLSVHERDALVRKVEARLLGLPELKTVYARTFGASQRVQGDAPEDVIGVIQLELIDWWKRRPAVEIIPELRARATDIPGILVQVREQESGPSGGKPIHIEIASRDIDKLEAAVVRLRNTLNDIGGGAVAQYAQRYRRFCRCGGFPAAAEHRVATASRP